MKVEIKQSEQFSEPRAVIYTAEITDEVRRVAALIENGAASEIITVTENERLIALRPTEIYMARAENERVALYTKTKKYISGRRLYEIEAALGEKFMRISKQTLINLSYIDYIEPSFSGVMLLVLKNGCKDYISRKYLPAFKKYLGI